MTRFVFLSFIFLGWAFYEVSGGQEFEPAPPKRVTTAKPAVAPVLAVADENDVDISAALAAESQPVPKPVKVSLVSAPAPTPVQERVALTPSPEELAKLAVAEEDPADIREVRGSRVNMRSGPGTRFSVLGTLTRGEKVEVLREPDNGWAKLKVLETGRIGWMSAKLLRTVE
ncbi:MAG: SH3 domain-containing protein [Rhodobacteraceae bacterium]|nr:SH3 domain-containing protein [Paracoccaceae bacterium]